MFKIFSSLVCQVSLVPSTSIFSFIDVDSCPSDGDFISWDKVLTTSGCVVGFPFLISQVASFWVLVVDAGAIANVQFMQLKV